MLIPFSHFAEIDALDENNLEDRALLCEALTPGVAKASAVALLVKLSQLRQRILQHRSASNTEKALGDAVFWLGAMIAVGIGTMTNDSELVNAARRNR